jgi:hypothetical protein
LRLIFRHTCKQVYTDERTAAAYRTLLNGQLNQNCHALALAYQRYTMLALVETLEAAHICSRFT